MQSDISARKSRGPRRKVALACGPCRERKSRCDGAKPICATCVRRGLPTGRCVYKSENARSASSDEYLRTLHQRIRELEANSADRRVMPAFEHPDETIATAGSESGGEKDVGPMMVEPVAPQPSTTATQNIVDHHPTSPRSQHTPTLGSSHTRTDHSPSPFGLPSNVSGMGAMTVANDCKRRPLHHNAEYFGSSSTASLMHLLTRDPKQQGRHAWASQRIPSPDTIGDANLWSKDTPSVTQVEDFLLPPRNLADHLLSCFWDRVYCLYPFFDRHSFQQAYEGLWIPQSPSSHNLTGLNIGLGDRYNSGPNSIVFICALNTIFALGCHFSDIPIQEREVIVYKFFLRAKRHIGLDMVDIHSIGVVQTLLIVALFLQSTPYPHRCWGSIGMACRLALGLGLHEMQLESSKNPLEQEIHRRTWHGCVMMDMTVSMTYGRPSMTTHLGSVPLPGMFDLESRQESECPSLITFYISTIKLYSILDSILSDVYKVWWGQSSESRTGMKQGGLDVIIQLEDQLLQYESSIPPFLSWRSPSTFTAESPNQLILNRQRNVLHSRFLYLLLLLYRPMLTQLCLEEQPDESNHCGSNSLHSFMFSKCAAGCIQAGIDLISLIHETHKTSTTDPWWYNGFYTSTAAMVLIMSYTCCAVKDIKKPTIDLAWQKAEDILQHMASFSISGRNTLKFLRTVRNKVLANLDVDQAVPRNSRQASQDPRLAQDHADMPELAFGAGHPLNWDGGLPENELGFLGPFNFTDFQDWFPQVSL